MDSIAWGLLNSPLSLTKGSSLLDERVLQLYGVFLQGLDGITALLFTEVLNSLKYAWLLRLKELFSPEGSSADAFSIGHSAVL